MATFAIEQGFLTTAVYRVAGKVKEDNPAWSPHYGGPRAGSGVPVANNVVMLTLVMSKSVLMANEKCPCVLFKVESSNQLKLRAYLEEVMEVEDKNPMTGRVELDFMVSLF